MNLTCNANYVRKKGAIVCI